MKKFMLKKLLIALISLISVTTFADTDVLKNLVKTEDLPEIIGRYIENGFKYNNKWYYLNAGKSAEKYSLIYCISNNIPWAVQSFLPGEVITGIKAPPTIDGYIFAGWNPEIPLKMPANNVIVNARYVKDDNSGVTRLFPIQSFDYDEYSIRNVNFSGRLAAPVMGPNDNYYGAVIIGTNVTSIGANAFKNFKSFYIKIPETVTNIEDYAFQNCQNLRSIYIPDSVKSIGANAFQGCNSLESIRLPNSIKVINDYTFYGCSNLRSIEIPNSVEYIGNFAFASCNNLKSIKIPDSVTSIGEYVFDSCLNLTSITIPNTIRNINNYAFRNCINLESIALPNSITNIGNNAFNYCSNLRSIKIPNAVISLGNEVFDGCINLVQITIPDSVRSFGRRLIYYCINLRSFYIPDLVTTVDSEMFDGCTNIIQFVVHRDNPVYTAKNEMLLSKDGKNLIKGINKEDVQIPNGVKTIKYNAFHGFTNLKSVTIPNSVENIEEGAFANSGLTSITIPNSVTNIETCVFYSCKDLETITFPEQVTHLGENVFSLCSNLKSIALPEGTRYITGYNEYNYDDGSDFAKCYSLTNIVIPASVTNIYDGAFNYCLNVESFSVSPENRIYSTTDDNMLISGSTLVRGINKENIILNSSINVIGGSAFRGMNNVTNISIKNTRDYIDIGDFAFTDCTNLESIITVSGNRSYPTRDFYHIGKYAFKRCKKLNTIDSSTNIDRSIDEGAFYGCENLESITIPNAYKDIGNETFFYCRNLKSLTIPNHITGIGNETFKNCDNLESITMGSNIRAIGHYAFNQCASLKTLTIFRPTASEPIKYISDYTFFGCNSLDTIIFNDMTKNEVKNIKENALNPNRNSYPFGAKSGTKFICSDGELIVQ